MSSPDVHATGHFFPNRNWLESHFTLVPREVLDFFEGDGISLENSKILDVGTGDGLIGLGLAAQANCEVIGIDPLPQDFEWLKQNAPMSAEKFVQTKYSFFQTQDNDWSFLQNDYDFAISWSAGEHFDDFSEVTKSIHKALKPNGKYFFQTYPLWDSRWGHHLFEWVPEFFHIGKDFTEIHDYLTKLDSTPNPILLASGESSTVLDEILLDRNLTREDWLKLCMESLKSCNQISLQQMLSDIELCGFKIAKLEFITSGFHLLPNMPCEIARGIEGVKLIANKL
jgi:2-polyprenyl-3-methyl-5-hydroxy-6-metoxy-1,4-benzoquinol methylase